MNKSSMNAWWILGLRGAIAIAFGILAIAWPDLTLLSLVALFAAYALAGGAVSIAGAVKNRKSDENWILLLLLGLVSVGTGLIALIHPGSIALVLVFLMGANALVAGVIDLAAAIRMRKIVRSNWLMLLNAAASIVFGVLVFLYPLAGALAMIWLISFYALVSGAAMLVLAFQLRSMASGAMDSPEDRRVLADRRMTPSHGHA